MIFRYICGHREYSKMWKDKLVTPIPRPCPYCLRTKYITIKRGKVTLILRRKPK